MASGDSVNFLLLVELIVVVIVVSAFLFYWNRLLGSVVAWCIRLYTWRAHNAYIAIESLQISPLAGRIAFRQLEYHSSNLSLRALHGHVTFRYWKLRVRQEADSQSSNVKRNRLPCRLSVYAEGVEGFVFNRTPAYDGIVERMKKYEEAMNAKEKVSEDSGTSQSDNLGKTTSTEYGTGARQRRSAKTTKDEQQEDVLQQSQSSGSSGSSPSKPNDATHELPRNPKPPKISTPEGVNWFRELVPLDIRIVTGSMILGNDATPMLLIGDFKSAEGTLEVSDSRSACDDYKMSMDLRFDAPKVLMRTNVDYSGPLLAHGKKTYDELYKKDPDVAKQPPSKLSSMSYFQTLARKFSFLQDPKFSSPPVAGLSHDKVWKGLARYRLDESGTAKVRKKEEREYAKVTTLLDSPALDLTYYADTPGPVPDPSEAEIIDSSDEFGNVEPPPEYGIDIAVHGGTIKYGPWADRQRDALQKAFAPAIFFHSDPKPRLQPGDTRVHTALLLNLTLTEETTLRIPTREPSKDWFFDNSPADIERRYGWLDVTVGPNSSITYTQSQLATKHGYDAMLVLHLDALSIASSVNLETFVVSKTCRVSMTMPTPLRWDAQRDWGLDIALDTIDVTLLRDHVQVISDLARDWSSGAVGDFHHFVPNHYNFRVTLRHYAFHLYINDFNIVNRPRSREDNAFMDVYGPAMACYIAVDATQYRPEFSIVPFTVTTHDARVELCTPVWDTQRSFGPGDVIEIGKIGELSASGNYRYYSTPQPDHQELLTLHLEAKQVVYKMLGWSLRRLFCVKDNYFGSFTQFTTMQEYLERFDHDPESVGDPVEEKYRPGRSDPFSAQVTMNVEESLILLSDQVYGCASGLAMPVPQLQMALTSTDHYLDLSLDALPTYVVPVKEFQAAYAQGEPPPPTNRETFFVEGIEVKAHRLFGPQPRATTYVCIWEINVPRITAFSSPEMQHTLQSVRQAITYTFQDFDNAPAEIYVPKTPPDVTFVKLGMGEIAMTIFDTDTAVSVSIPEGINVDTSTWATRAYQAAVALVVPKVCVRLLSRANNDWVAVSSIDLDLSLNVFNAPRGWHDQVMNQQAFVRAQDGPTGRVRFMYASEDMDGISHANGHYLPTPWNALEDYDGSDASSISDTASSMMDLSSMGSDGEASPERRSVRPRSRARSYVTARQGSEESLTATDVSDSSTESGFTSGDSTSKRPPVHDMPGVLADTLGRFKKLQYRFVETPVRDPDEAPENFAFGTNGGVAEGRIIRILSRSIRVDTAATAVICGIQIFRSLIGLSESPERLLDNLLLWQIKPLLNIVKAEPIVIDVSLPRVVARVTLGDLPTIASALNLDLRGVQTRVLQDPRSDEERSKSDIMVAVQRLSFAVTSATRTGKTYLESSASSSFAASYPNRVFNLSLAKSQVAISPAGSKIIVHQRYGDVNLSFVNSAIDVFSSWIQTLTAIQKEVAGLATRSRPYVAMLYRICRAAEDADITLSMPQFMSETAYGLHIQDQRSIRQDLGWILLAKLRHWYRLSGRYYQASNTPSEDMARDLVRGLASMEEAADGEETLIAQQGFIHHALGTHLSSHATSKETDEQKATTVMLYVGSLNLHHHGPTLEGRSSTNLVHIASASFGIHLTTPQRDAINSSQTRILAAIKSLELDLHNSLLLLVDHMQPLRDALPKPRPENDTVQPENRNLILDLQCESLQLGVSAAGLKGNITLEKHHTSLAHRTEARRNGTDLDRHHHSLVMIDSSKAEVTVFQPQTDSPDAKGPIDRMVILVGVRGHEAVLETHDHFDATRPKSIKVIMGLQHFEVDSRPQLRHFLTFAREWKSQHAPTYATYLRRMASPKSSPSPASPPARPLCPALPAIIQVDLSIQSGQIQIRAAKAVWLRWELAKIFLTLRCTDKTTRFGIKIAPQLVGAYESPKKKDESGAVLRLPSIAATGFFRLLEHEPQLSTSVQLGFFTGIIKPAMLDRLLLLHKRLGRDVEQLIKEYGIRQDLSTSTSASSSLSSPPPPSPSVDPIKTSRLPIRLEVRCAIEGVRFGLRADDVATTLLFEALALTAHASNTHDQEASLSWRAKANHFGLSLGHLGTGALSVDAEPMKKHRSAYMVLDVDVQEIPASDTTSSQLNVYLNRVHTVMHISALSELSDLVKSWQSDLHILRDNRATEVAEVKHTTSRFFKKLDPGEKSSTENSWFATRLVSIHVAGLGLAIPLLDAKAISSQRKEELHGVPALLFSIRTIDFMNRRNETARFKVQRIALQFINKFDQGVSEHFSGDFHPSSNRMSLPSLESEAQMSSSEDTWTLSAHCAATDFRLSLAPDLADGIFRLMDLYEQGRDRFLELERNYRSEAATATERMDSVALKYDEEISPISPRKSQRIVIRMSYTFNSGIVELHRVVAHEHKKTTRRTNWLDIFHLPTISLWVDYQGANAESLPHTTVERDTAQLILSCAVHESRNTLRPSILPFFVELTNRIQQRVRQKHQSKPAAAPKDPKLSAEPLTAALSESTLHIIAPSKGAIAVRLSLRIDRSELRFSCAPDSNAYADLKWESGGFLATTTLGRAGVSTVAGSISDITSTLSHEFAERGNTCIEAGAKDMAFSLALCPGEGSGQSGLSVVFDTQLSGQFRLDAFSSWLIFIAVWVDDAPQLDMLEHRDSGIPSRSGTPTMELPASTAPEIVAHHDVHHNKLAVAILARFRSIDFDANIGVSRTHLEISPILLQTSSNGERTAVDVRIGTTKVSAKGDMSGELTSQSLSFNTTRRSSRASTDFDATVLSMAIEGGDLSGSLFLADTNILRFHLEPTTVSLADDWQAFTRDPTAQVFLSFTVKAGLFQGVLRLLAIPRLLGNLYSIIDMAESQSVIAAQRSVIFKTARSRRKVEPSPVAAILLQSAAKKVASSPSTVKTAQTMRFDLAGIDVGLFNEDYENGHVYDFYRFVVGKVEADLKRQLSKENLPTRDLGLLVAFVRWDNSDGARVAAQEQVSLTAGEMIEAATKVGRSEVASLPVMTLVMNSVEYSNPSVLDFNFDLTWGETDGDVKILPSFFEQARLAFNKLIKGLDEQEMARAKRSDPDDPISTAESARRRKMDETASAAIAIEYRNRDPTKSDKVPIPRLKMLGEGTGDAAKLIPVIMRGVKELPKLSHRFVTLPLEEGMDLLLKLYEKQLPETAGRA